VKILLEHLRKHVNLPESARECRELLDDVGVEVKAVEETPLGTVFSVELLANRGDHYSYSGIAREASGRTGARLQYPQARALDIQPAPADRVRVESPLCLVYTLTELTAPAAAGSLPDDILAPMLAADMHATLAPVDASNVTNLDLGQPTHAFDADTIDGAITIRTSRTGERAWLLFTPEPVKIPEGTLVIADDSKIVGIAGVIGCVESAVTDRTRRILLESACFDPTSIRIASRQLNQPTDAAARFMRGGDPSLPLIGAARVAWLLETYCGYSVGTAFRAGDWSDPRRTIEVDVAAMRRFTGAPIDAPEMVDRLTRYGFALSAGAADVASGRNGFYADTKSLAVIVPPYRLWDVHFEADIAEELLKSVGYNSTGVTLPHVAMGALPSRQERIVSQVSEVFVAEGFYEIFTDSFYSRRMRERLGLREGDPLWEHVETQNSIEKDYSLLRNNTVAQALDALATNVNLKNANVKMFEWARTFIPDPSAENGVCREEAVLWALANGRDRGPFWGDKGRPADAYYFKGIVEQLRTELRLDLKVGPATGHRSAPLLHPGRSAAIHLGDRVVGVLGEIHPSLVQSFDIKRQRPVYLEIDTNALFEQPLAQVYAEPPSRQPIVRNVAYAIPSGITAAEVKDTLAGAAPPFLRQIRIVDIYEIPNDASQARAITYEIEYLSDDALTGETINAATETMMAAIEQRFGNRVSLRT
jgi:phenylalanyl-tRNA synthetase beta chain